MALTRTDLVERRAALRNTSQASAEEVLDGLIAFHAVSLPEALWRYGFCRPADSRAAADMLKTT